MFGPQATNGDFYSTAVAPLLTRALDGFNVTIFAYGQTGSGKTFTMTEGLAAAEAPLATLPGHAGIAPRLMADLFNNLQQGSSSSSAGGNVIDFKVRVQCLEIYNEGVFDLLSTGGAQQSVNVVIRETPDGETVATGVTERPVTTCAELASELRRGMAARQTASTTMNARSSRSHMIFTIIIEQTTQDADAAADTDDGATGGSGASRSSVGLLRRTSRIHLVDLAGSERAKRTGASGDRLKEGVSINKSLLALGNVINALAGAEDENQQQQQQQGNNDAGASSGAAAAASSAGGRHIPYRDSKLTRLLKSSLGGNAHTLMIACASPADSNIDETLSTLRYASRARKIVNNATVNTDPMSAAMAGLRRQVKELQDLLTQTRAAAGLGLAIGGGSGGSGGGVYRVPASDVTPLPPSSSSSSSSRGAGASSSAAGGGGHAVPCPCGRTLHLGCAASSSSSSSSSSASGAAAAAPPQPLPSQQLTQALQRLLAAENANRNLIDECQTLKQRVVGLQVEADSHFDASCAASSAKDALMGCLGDMVKAVRSVMSRASALGNGNADASAGAVLSSSLVNLIPTSLLADLPWLADCCEKVMSEVAAADSAAASASAADDDDDDEGMGIDFDHLELDLSDLVPANVKPAADGAVASSSSSSSTSTSASAGPILNISAARTEIAAIHESLQAKQRLLAAYDQAGSGKHGADGAAAASSGSTSSTTASSAAAVELSRVSAQLASVTSERDQLAALEATRQEQQSAPQQQQQQPSDNEVSLAAVAAAGTGTSGGGGRGNNITVVTATAQEVAAQRTQLAEKQAQILALQARQADLQRLVSMKGRIEGDRARLASEIDLLKVTKTSLSKALREEQARQRDEVKRARAVASTAVRDLTKAQLEQARLASALEKQSVVMKRQLEEKEKISKRLKDASGQLASMRTAVRAQGGGANIAPALQPSSSSSSSASTASLAGGADALPPVPPSSNTVFYAVASAHASIAAMSGKGGLYSLAMGGQVRQAVRKGLIALPEWEAEAEGAGDEGAGHDAGGGAATMGMEDDDLLAEQLQDASASSSSSSSYVTGPPSDGLVSLADCFANPTATKVPSTLRSLIEGDVAARVTLRRAGQLAARLHSERKALTGKWMARAAELRRQQQLQQDMEGASAAGGGNTAAAIISSDPLLSSLDTQLAVMNSQFSTVVDVIVTLRTQLDPDAALSSSGNGSNTGTGGGVGARGSAPRTRAKQWTSEVSDIHTAKKTIAWLASAVTALADNCDAAVAEVVDERARSEAKLAKVKCEREASDGLRRHAEALVRAQQAEIGFLLGQVAASAGSSNSSNTVTTTDAVPPPPSSSSSLSTPDASSLARLLSVQATHIDTLQAAAGAAVDLQGRLADTEAALAQARLDLAAARAGEVEARAALAVEGVKFKGAGGTTAAGAGAGAAGGGASRSKAATAATIATTSATTSAVIGGAAAPAQPSMTDADVDAMVVAALSSSLKRGGPSAPGAADDGGDSLLDADDSLIDGDVEDDDSDDDSFVDCEDRGAHGGGHDDGDDDEAFDSDCDDADDGASESDYDDSDDDSDRPRKRKRKTSGGSGRCKAKSAAAADASAAAGPGSGKARGRGRKPATSDAADAGVDAVAAGDAHPASKPAAARKRKAAEMSEDGDNVNEGTSTDAGDATSAKPKPSKPRKAAETCKCKAGANGKKSCKDCACTKAGRKCGDGCKCGDSCGNRHTTSQGSEQPAPAPEVGEAAAAAPSHPAVVASSASTSAPASTSPCHTSSVDAAATATVPTTTTTSAQQVSAAVVSPAQEGAVKAQQPLPRLSTSSTASASSLASSSSVPAGASRPSTAVFPPSSANAVARPALKAVGHGHHQQHQQYHHVSSAVARPASSTGLNSRPVGAVATATNSSGSGGVISSRFSIGVAPSSSSSTTTTAVPLHQRAPLSKPSTSSSSMAIARPLQQLSTSGPAALAASTSLALPAATAPSTTMHVGLKRPALGTLSAGAANASSVSASTSMGMLVKKPLGNGLATAFSAGSNLTATAVTAATTGSTALLAAKKPRLDTGIGGHGTGLLQRPPPPAAAFSRGGGGW